MSTRRLLLATVLPAALLAGPVAGIASAETPAPGAVSGAPGTVTFTAAAGRSPITKIEVDLPVGTPMRDVTVPPAAGFTSSTTSEALPSCGDQVVDSVTWTATGAGAAPAQTGDFAIHVGSFPQAPRMQLQGVVSYADGTSASWTQAEGVQAPGVAAAPPAATAPSAVTVSADSAAPATPAPAGNSITRWMSSLVTATTSVW